MKRLFLDVETPNRHNDKICGLGIICEDEGRVVFEENYLINPETEFDDINIDIHGIRPCDVNGEKTFPNIWPEIKGFFDNSIIVGHNVSFDLSVLEKTLNYYGLINEPTEISYECTYEKSKRIFNIQRYRLNDVCDYLNIELDNHHDALCDAKASMSIFHRIMELDGWNNYDIHKKIFVKGERKEKQVFHTQRFSDKTIAIRALNSILLAVSEDGIISEKELYSLSIWVEQLGVLKQEDPFDKISSVIEAVLEDGIVSKEENEFLLSYFDKTVDPLSHMEPTSEDEIDIIGKTFCLSGNFFNGSKSDFEKRLVEMGAIPAKSVTKKTDILIVGSVGSSEWAYGNYGSKVKRALELQKSGIPIKIIGESEIFK